MILVQQIYQQLKMRKCCGLMWKDSKTGKFFYLPTLGQQFLIYNFFLIEIIFNHFKFEKNIYREVFKTFRQLEIYAFKALSWNKMQECWNRLKCATPINDRLAPLTGLLGAAFAAIIRDTISNTHTQLARSSHKWKWRISCRAWEILHSPYKNLSLSLLREDYSSFCVIYFV